MPAATAILTPPLRARTAPQGSIYIPVARPAQPISHPSIQRSRPVRRPFIQRLYGVFTVIAVCGLISPLIVATLTFPVVPT